MRSRRSIGGRNKRSSSWRGASLRRASHGPASCCGMTSEPWIILLAALDQRIKVAVDVGWMSSLASHVRRHVVNSIGLTFHIIGLYRYLDLPDLAALIAPRSVLVINGSRDQLFPAEGVDAAFKKI